jgi:hypothetical protein
MSKELCAFHRLQKAAAVVQKQHLKLDELAKSLEVDVLEKLIKAIENCNLNDIPKLAPSLTTKEANLLVYLLIRDLKPMTIYKTLHLLEIRANPRQLVQGWSLFRNHPGSEQLRKGLSVVSKSLYNRQSQLPEFTQKIQQIFLPSYIDLALVSELAKSNLILVDWLSGVSSRNDYSKPDSFPLYGWMQNIVLRLGDRNLLVRHGLEEIETWFNSLPAKFYADASVNYINVLYDYEWKISRIEEVVERYGLPASENPFWQNVDDKKRKAIQRLIGYRLIADFFEGLEDPNRRFEFWNDYVDYLTDAVYPKDRSRILFKFTNFLLVEFRDVNNAGYIYPLNEAGWLETVVADEFQIHDACKDRDRATYRIIHNKNWQENTRYLLESYL